MGENGENARVISNYYNVDGEFWYTVFDGYTTSSTNKKNVYWNAFYYDNDMNKAKTIQEYVNNGFAVGVPLNDWRNDINWYYDDSNYDRISNYPRYGPNVKKVQLEFSVGNNNYSDPTVKIRNFKLYGKMFNSFYLINVDATDNTRIKTIKYEYGNKDKKYFKNSGTFVKNNQFKVTKNGTYTVYVSDVYRNETVSTITIDKIN